MITSRQIHYILPRARLKLNVGDRYTRGHIHSDVQNSHRSIEGGERMREVVLSSALRSADIAHYWVNTALGWRAPKTATSATPVSEVT